MEATLTRLLYGLGVRAVVWGGAVPITLCRMALGRASRSELLERLGRASGPEPERSTHRLVIHAVSAGEMRAAGALAAELQARWPGASVVLSTGTDAGRRVADAWRRDLSNVEACVLAPWDRQAAVRTWLQQVGADAVVVVETEIWPGLFWACQDAAIPLFLVSGRLPSNDVWRYGLIRPFMRSVLRTARWVGVQDDAQRAAFVRIGSPPDRTVVMGDLKADGVQPIESVPDAWREQLEHVGSLIVAGSTHAPEERMLLDAFEALRPEFPPVKLLIAPRHVRRASGIRHLANRRGLGARLWSEGPPEQSWDILVLDRFGLLRALYEFADVVFVGGSLSRNGGHNVLEAAACGRAIVTGPHVDRIGGTVVDLEAADAIIRLSADGRSSGPLRDGLRELLRDPDRRQRMGDAARTYGRARQGVARLYADRIMSEFVTRRPQDAATSSD